MSAGIVRTCVLLAIVASPGVVSAWAAEQPAGGSPHGSFSEDCGLCHKPEAWKPAFVSPKFDHKKYGFGLKGAHAILGCRACHASLEFKKAGTTCVDCHQDVHRGEFGTDCARCHTTTNFIDHAAELRRHRTSRFPLTGAHVALDCTACHPPASSGQAQYVNTPTECERCHLGDYDATTNPNHAASGFSHDCVECHSTASWQSGSVNHSLTGFPLTGTHKAVPCDSCHPGAVFAGTPTDCNSCHATDYASTTNPSHTAARFPTACQRCHNTRSWIPSTFNHNTTALPLTGAHRSLICNDCHGGGVFSGLNTACVSCHQQDYNGTTSPVHSTAGFSTNCQTCHTTTAWQGATFDHSATAFPLTGVHRTTACNDCHGGGVYAGLNTACVSCHQQDYDGTTNPGHAAAGFPTDCASCHTTNGWQGATFNHDTRFFPIYSGRHRGLWSSCTTCHINAANYSQFTCFSCHPHSDRAKTDSDHRGRNGYSYDSQACYNCHPRGRADD